MTDQSSPWRVVRIGSADKESGSSAVHGGVEEFRRIRKRIRKGRQGFLMQGKSRCKNPEQVSEESEISGMKNDETSISWEEVL
jgi:hypothetical protein